ncbi:hypothetical protein EOM09_08310 [bacterium]|nr:hypothetical protein [bacterium]
MNKKQIQILYIHGGGTFKNNEEYIEYLKTREIKIEETERWSDEYFDKKLSKKFKMIKPKMPCKENAKYEEWKIQFERYLEKIDQNLVLIGTSLGGIFLAKYLSENTLNKNIISTYLIAPPFDAKSVNEKEIYGGFELKDNLEKIEENCKKVVFMFSKNDNVVNISAKTGYQEKLKKSEFIEFEDKNGHFKISKFPEIIEMLKEDYKNNI